MGDVIRILIVDYHILVRSSYTGSDLKKLLFKQTFHLKTVGYTGLNHPFDYQNHPANSLAFLEAYAFVDYCFNQLQKQPRKKNQFALGIVFFLKV